MIRRADDLTIASRDLPGARFEEASSVVWDAATGLAGLARCATFADGVAAIAMMRARVQDATNAIDDMETTLQ